MDLAPATTDDALLSRYLHDGDEGAFATLVRSHERMVLGTAWRHTRDADLARDIAQQVFATLAQKARLLAGRKSLAGWLHIAATHVASRTRSAEEARRNRHEQAAVRDADRTNEDAGPLLEEALDRLNTADREALILHYFEDRSYAEMAALLGLQEVAARKRVSRALERLGTQLRRRGFSGSTIAALVGASAIQAGLPTVTVAGTALGAATATATSSFALTLTTVMGNTAFKIAATVVLASAIPIAWQSHANSALRADIDEARRASETVAPSAPPSDPETASSRAEIAALTARLEAARRREVEATAQLADSQQQLNRIQQEVLVKFGNTEDLARTFAAKIEQILPVLSAFEKKQPFDAITQANVEQAMKVAMEMLPFLGQLRRMDEEPEQAARFAATLATEVLKLPPDTTAAIERIVADGYADLKRDGLTLSAKPKENVEAWTARRDAADKALATRVLATLPEAARNHPVLKLIGADEEPTILLPSATSVLGSLPGMANDFLKANRPKTDDERKQP